MNATVVEGFSPTGQTPVVHGEYTQQGQGCMVIHVKDAQVVWNDYVCNPALIPISERVIVMWIWLLWSSHQLPTFLNQKICSQALVGQRGVEERLNFLQHLRSKRMITRDEFSRKRSCILNCL
jgi:hypothetical protein